jgi:queuosine precursor transporter
MKLYLWAAAYISLIAAANYTATNFLYLGPLAISIGTILFGLVFTVRDRLHAFGRPTVYISLALAALSSLAVLAPSIATGDQISIRILIASITALILSESTDTEIYQRLITRPWLQKSLISNTFSVPLDSIIFNLIAFAGTELTIQLPSIIAGEIVYKFLSSTLLALVLTIKIRAQNPKLA